MNTPNTDGRPPSPNATIEQVVQDLMTRQRATETVIKAAEEAVSAAEIRNREMQQQHDEQMRVLLQAIERLSATAPKDSEGGTNLTGPREWKPPVWDGKTTTFRDYLIRIRSSYKVRSGLNPTLSREYY
jgi:hypothetical protein